MGRSCLGPLARSLLGKQERGWIREGRGGEGGFPECKRMQSPGREIRERENSQTLRTVKRRIAYYSVLLNCLLMVAPSSGDMASRICPAALPDMFPRMRTAMGTSSLLMMTAARVGSMAL